MPHCCATIDELVLVKREGCNQPHQRKKQTTTSKTPSGNIECEKGTRTEVMWRLRMLITLINKTMMMPKFDNTNNAIKGTPHERIMVDETMQFPFDAANEILNEHSYCFFKCQEESSVKTNDSDFQAEFFFEHPHPTAEAAESGDELFSSPPSSPVKR
ncbi:hypothetical protein OS493_012577 [Desmophyllum pertusum]|uniref:Uncharacterized protein n=1 Tax=Desmophyllum pertusum TaxID=174260 RepID=A0A9X0CZ77_9CNID|nr:hypothetical protein OS493_012577 [Desmophyllum pertusum]